MIGNGLTRPESCFPIWVYQCLPDLTPPMLNPLVFLVWSTNRYHSADLSLGRGLEAFTKHYHRDGGLGHDLGVGVAWWCGPAWPGLCRVRMVAHHQKWQTPSARYRKDFFHQAGRLVFFMAWW